MSSPRRHVNYPWWWRHRPLIDQNWQVPLLIWHAYSELTAVVASDREDPTVAI